MISNFVRNYDNSVVREIEEDVLLTYPLLLSYPMRKWIGDPSLNGRCENAYCTRDHIECFLIDLTGTTASAVYFTCMSSHLIDSFHGYETYVAKTVAPFQ